MNPHTARFPHPDPRALSAVRMFSAVNKHSRPRRHVARIRQTKRSHTSALSGVITNPTDPYASRQTRTHHKNRIEIEKRGVGV